MRELINTLINACTYESRLKNHWKKKHSTRQTETGLNIPHFKFKTHDIAIVL